MNHADATALAWSVATPIATLIGALVVIMTGLAVVKEITR